MQKAQLKNGWLKASKYLMPLPATIKSLKNEITIVYYFFTKIILGRSISYIPYQHESLHTWLLMNPGKNLTGIP